MVRVVTRLMSGMHGGGSNCRLRRGAETISSTDFTRLRCKLLWPARLIVEIRLPLWQSSHLFYAFTFVLCKTDLLTCLLSPAFLLRQTAL